MWIESHSLIAQFIDHGLLDILNGAAYWYSESEGTNPKMVQLDVAGYSVMFTYIHDPERQLREIKKGSVLHTVVPPKPHKPTESK